MAEDGFRWLAGSHGSAMSKLILMTPEEARMTACALRPGLCLEFHGGNCLYHIISHFAMAFISALKFYFPLHFLPLLLRLSQMRKE